LLYTTSIGLAVIGIVLAASTVGRFMRLDVAIEEIMDIAILVTLFYVGYSAWLSAHTLKEEV